MTTSDLVKALRICFRDLDDGADCPNCPLYGNENCLAEVMGGAADLLEWLISANADLHEELEWKDKVITLAQKKQTEAEAERDALLPYAKEYGCETCKNEKACFVQTREGVTVSCVKCPVPDTCPCSQCKDCGKWEWRGLPEAPVEGEES